MKGKSDEKREDKLEREIDQSEILNAPRALESSFDLVAVPPLVS